MKTKFGNKSTHLLTARQKGQSGRILIQLAIVAFVIFALCSFYALYLEPANPAAWVMAIFFVVGLFIILTYEENVFPDLPKQKLPYAIGAWILGWIFVAYFVSFIATMNTTHLTIALVFGFVLVLGAIYVIANEKQWANFKTKAKSNTGGRIKRAVGKTKAGKKLEARSKRRKRLKAERKKKRRVRIKGW